MSVMEIRGGVPRVSRITFDATGRRLGFKGTLKYIQLATGLTPCRLYFTEDDFLNDVNYLVRNVWEGPVEIEEIWIKGEGGNSDVEIVAYFRRA